MCPIIHDMDLRELNLNLLLVLEALLTEASVTRAGVRVGLSQPATSAALKQLRMHLGDPLLVRKGTAMQLTPRAQMLRAPLQHALEQLSRALAGDASFDPMQEHREVRICASDYVLAVLGHPLFSRLQKEAPHLRLRFGRMRSNDLERALLDATIDLAVGAFAPTSERIGRDILFLERVVALVCREHPAVPRAAHGVLSESDLYTYPQVHVATHRIHGSLPADFSTSLFDRPGQVVVDGHLSALHLVPGTRLIYLCAAKIAALVAEDPRYTALALPLDTPTTPVCLLHAYARGQDPLLSWARELIVWAARVEDSGESAS